MPLLYEDLTYKIRGACFWVYREFGGAFKEGIVDKALTKELQDRGLKVEDQKRINIYYRGEKVGVYIPDKIVDEKILLEIKCKPGLIKSDQEQFWKYLKGSTYKLGLLINFGPERLEIKRIIYDKIREK
jgi:GxxExxY protein